jgi:hypothetical protein
MIQNSVFLRNLLYSALTRYGSSYKLKIKLNEKKFMDELSDFADQWKKYNPEHKVERYGLSITSLDGEFYGIPDLDSLLRYNKAHSTNYTELDFVKKTPLYEKVKECFAHFEPYVCRSHVIKLGTGGFFPMHRDANEIDIHSFRLFIPLQRCNPHTMHFILDNKVLRFEHGSVYFIDTCLEHVLFNASYTDEAYFIVLNIELTEESVNSVLANKAIK